MTSEVVRYRTVSITVYPWRHPSGRDYWRFQRNDGKHTTRSTLEKAKAAAKIHAQDIHRGTLDLSSLSPDQTRKLQRIVEADPTLALVDEFLLWHSRKAPKKLLGEALDEFLAAKEANRGRSAQNVKTLTTRLSILKPLRGKCLSQITVHDLPAAEGAPRTRKNIRSSMITFFRWCQKYEYLPHGEKTAPERLETPISRRKVPATYTPHELRTLLANVAPKFLPWLACGAFAGIRMDELHPLPGGEKSPLDWADFDWKKKVIRIRPETDKNGYGRVTPIHPVLRHWLYPVMKPEGPLITSLPSSGNEPETTRLGRLVGGWKANALRHSYISYRAAKVGLAKAAMECGNSESEAKKSYNDAKTEADSDEWFRVVPKSTEQTKNSGKRR
jgi:integrase